MVIFNIKMVDSKKWDMVVLGYIIAIKDKIGWHAPPRAHELFIFWAPNSGSEGGPKRATVSRRRCLVPFHPNGAWDGGAWPANFLGHKMLPALAIQSGSYSINKSFSLCSH